MATVKIKVSPDGSKVEVGVEGVSGSSCTDLTEGIEEALMGGEPKRNLTDEYYQEPGIDIQESI